MSNANTARWKTYHLKLGEPIRWWKAIPVPVGTAGRQGDKRAYIEQTLDPIARFLISNTEETVESEQFGLVTKGTMQISAFPDWARFNHLDIVSPQKAGRLRGAMVSITRGATDSDELPRGLAYRVANVYIGGTAQSSADYQLTQSGVNSSLQWLLNAPGAGIEYAVEYEYFPRYVVLPQRATNSPTGSDGGSMPLSYWLNQSQEFE